jgi:hypothetical protein
MMTNAQQGFTHYQQPPPQTDIGKMLSEVLNRISGLDEKLVRLDDVDKKIVKNHKRWRVLSGVSWSTSCGLRVGITAGFTR